MSDPAPLFIIGAGGHAKVVANVALDAGLNVAGFLSDSKNDLGKDIFGLPILDRQNHPTKAAACHIAIGSNKIRPRLAEEIASRGWSLQTIIHPSAVLGRNVNIGAGTFVGPQAVIHPGVTIGQNVIINTAAIIEHDCHVGNAVHISPRAVLGGHVSVGAESWIGIGTTVRDRVHIGAHVMIGAGSVVVCDIEGPGTAYGVPAKLKPGS